MRVKLFLRVRKCFTPPRRQRRWRSPMRTRWIIGVALASVLLTAVGASAAVRESGASPSATAKTSIDFWNYWDGDNAKAISSLIDKFNATHPDITVKNV